jgi:alkylation response protein AidB-like acyl-CoA dehydrogenase
MTARRPAQANDAMPTTRGLNFYLADPNLEFVCSTLLPAADLARARPHLIELGALAGQELDALAAESDRHPPVLRTHDARGQRVDDIVCHPAYREMERLAFGRFGLAAMSHRPGVLGWLTPVPHTIKYALSYLFAQSEFGLLCPVSLTDSTARLLRRFGSPSLQAAWLPRLTATDVEHLGQGTQWMTERTGGSDVGASTVQARRDADGTWRLWGDKWFCSNAGAEVAITLARPEGAPAGTRGLGMFLVPRRLPDGARNAWTLNRLKDKFGSRSMATGEVTYAGAVAHVVGALDQGFRQMMEMVNVSRLSNAMRAAGIMRRCVLESLVHARARLAFGQPLAELPVMRHHLLEMLLDAEAAASVVLHAAASLDRWDAGGGDGERRLLRSLTPLAKYWITARARWVASEAMNVRGGNGYVEEWVNPRLVRDAYLGAIWEGTSNVVALDVQRAIVREGCLTPLIGYAHGRLDAVTDPLAKGWAEEIRLALAAVEREAGRWTADAEAASRELAARPAADLLYHAVAASLLLGEGQALADARGDHRKFAAAALYTRRWLRARTPLEAAFGARHLAMLDALADWTPVDRATALALDRE